MRTPPTSSPAVRPIPGRPLFALGVHATNTSNNVLIESVVPGSPADILGLEPDDRIKSVDGFEVGLIRQGAGLVSYSIQSEFRRSSGEVDLVVYDHRTKRDYYLPCVKLAEVGSAYSPAPNTT